MPEARVEVRWQDLFAARTRAGSGEGLVFVMGLTNEPGLISFAGGFPDPATFPRDVLPELLAGLLDSGDFSPLQYSSVEGLPTVRDFVRGRLERNEGSRPAEDELMVTSGGIEALELVGKAFLDPGDLVLVEGPTYLGAIMAFQSFEAQVVAVELDEEGLDVGAVAGLLASGMRPKLLYTIPDHQNPAGVSLSTERRIALVELARRYGFLIVEDVAYRELGFEDDRPPSLWSLAPDVVLQAGTFSKIFFPGVRLGWGAGPAEVVEKLTWAKQNTDQGAGALGQRLLEEYGRRGFLDEHIRNVRGFYERRCRLLLEALAEHMPESVSWTIPRGGFFTWLTLRGGEDAVELVQRAIREARVGFVPGEPFFPDGRGRSNVRLSFSKVEDEDIPVGVERLGRLLRQV